jgi:4-hydroxythreonine-4-phosphate dehydrogenase
MIGITIGDVSGIGPEITLKALSSLSSQRSNILIIGNKKILENLQRKFVWRGSNLAKSNIIDAFDDFKYKFSKVQKQCGIASFLQLHLASQLLKVGKIHGIVTAPVSKTALAIAGFPYAGQTEYFATEFGVKKYGMLAWSKELKIILVTIHKPLKGVPKLITEQNVLEKIKLLNDYFIRFEKKRKPKIGVLALNPHAFEFSCGAEEKILKAIKQARKLGISAEGPIPADSALIFTAHSSRFHRFDAFVAMYHDQGMLPVKIISQGTGVNMTLGLPFIRTAPLHGVAFDIAGKNGNANPDAMLNAIRLCQKLIEN